MKDKCGVYKITNTVNGKCIVGISININKRWYIYKSLLNNNKWPNPHLQNAWNKYGEQNFKFEILLECPEEKLNEEEIRLILEYKTQDRAFGYNIKEGGDRSRLAEETKKKISIALKGRKKSRTHKKNLSIANMGHKVTQEIKEKISKGNMGKKMSLEAIEKIRQSNTGKCHSKKAKEKMSKSKLNMPAETKKKISESHKGSLHPLFGKHHSEATKNKQSESNKGKMHSIDSYQRQAESLKLYYAKKKATQNKPSSLFDNNGDIY